MIRLWSKILLCFLSLTIFVQTGLAQPIPPIVDTHENVDTGQKLTSLSRLLQSINRTDRELDALEAQLKTIEPGSRLDRAKVQVQELASRHDELEASFISVASGINDEVFQDQKHSDIDFSKELKDLLRPLINEVTRLSRRPRDLDRLRTEVETYQNQLVQIGIAKANLETLIAKSRNENNPDLTNKLIATKAKWEALEQDVQDTESNKRRELTNKENERKSFSESISDIAGIFFKSRGKNLLLALLAAVLFTYTFRKFHHWAWSRADLDTKRVTFSRRLLSVISLLSTVVGAVAVFLIALFFFGDWVLLILGIMLVLGLIWTSKHAIPAFWHQALLLLNVGSVREGERVQINGISWIVSRLNLYCNLENPALDGGKLRIPIADLRSMRSREGSSVEPFFPTNKGEWVLLSDGCFGKIRMQSLEDVEVEKLGGSVKTYQTADFLKLMPEVLSDGFRVSSSFGVDYRHQALVTKEIPQTLEAFIRKELARHGYDQHLVQLRVELEEAAASSLVIAVLADFKGAAAPYFNTLKRLVQRMCVDACNANGWTIPFPQLAVHVAKDG